MRLTGGLLKSSSKEADGTHPRERKGQTTEGVGGWLLSVHGALRCLCILNEPRTWEVPDSGARQVNLINSGNSRFKLS